MHKKNFTTQLTIPLLLTFILILSACSQAADPDTFQKFDTFEDAAEAADGTTVTILMWGGNEGINQYMDTFVADNLKEKYNVTLNRVPMNAPEYLAKLLNEKKNGVDIGTADVLWINAENFRTAKEGGLLSGPFTDLLANYDTYYDETNPDLNYDSGILIEGYEGIWGKAQLVLSYDEALLPNPPKNFAELKDWVKENPGKFTFPKVPEDFVGTAFVRTAFYELTGTTGAFPDDMTQEEFNELANPVIDYFKEIEPYLWQEGQTYPASQAQLDELFKNGEVYMTMGFEIGKTAGLVASGVYPETVKTFVFDTGTIGNSHYLAVPFNAPEKAAALMLIDFLESPEAQLEKMKPEVWGDMPAFDVTKINSEAKATLNELDSVDGGISLAELSDNRLPEMPAKYIDWIKELWTANLAN